MRMRSFWRQTWIAELWFGWSLEIETSTEKQGRIRLILINLRIILYGCEYLTG